MRDDAGMVLTTAKYYLPDGTTIAGTGVEPDVAVEVNEETFHKSVIQLLPVSPCQHSNLKRSLVSL